MYVLRLCDETLAWWNQRWCLPTVSCAHPWCHSHVQVVNRDGKATGGIDEPAKLISSHNSSKNHPPLSICPRSAELIRIKIKQRFAKNLIVKLSKKNWWWAFIGWCWISFFWGRLKNLHRPQSIFIILNYFCYLIESLRKRKMMKSEKENCSSL